MLLSNSFYIKNGRMNWIISLNMIIPSFLIDFSNNYSLGYIIKSWKADEEREIIIYYF